MQVEDIKVLNVDGVAYEVSETSDAVQRLVEIYNNWNRKEADVRNELMMVQAAKTDLSRQIIMQHRSDITPAESKGENATVGEDQGTTAADTGNE